jgi:hypothetical protein
MTKSDPGLYPASKTVKVVSNQFRLKLGSQLQVF